MANSIIPVKHRVFTRSEDDEWPDLVEGDVTTDIVLPYYCDCCKGKPKYLEGQTKDGRRPRLHRRNATLDSYICLPNLPPDASSWDSATITPNDQRWIWPMVPSEAGIEWKRTVPCGPTDQIVMEQTEKTLAGLPMSQDQ